MKRNLCPKLCGKVGYYGLGLLAGAVRFSNAFLFLGRIFVSLALTGA